MEARAAAVTIARITLTAEVITKIPVIQDLTIHMAAVTMRPLVIQDLTIHMVVLIMRQPDIIALTTLMVAVTMKPPGIQARIILMEEVTPADLMAAVEESSVFLISLSEYALTP